MQLAPGTRLGPYEILSPIGAGGMGEVWKARDTRLGRVVAIKKVKEQHRERFKQEARSIAALNHNYICQIFDIGPDYLVLEYVEGKPLSGPLPGKEAMRLAIQIATALEKAHRNGIIHRDLKPSNIMVTDKGSVKLLDFGLAKLYEKDAAISTSPTTDFPATQAGAVLGTVAYMSPEQAQGQPTDARSYIFSFGLVLYEMLSGGRAFASESPLTTAAALIKEEAPPLQTLPLLEKIIRRCLAKRPAERYPSMAEVRNALEQAGAADCRPTYRQTLYGKHGSLQSAPQGSLSLLQVHASIFVQEQRVLRAGARAGSHLCSGAWSGLADTYLLASYEGLMRPKDTSAQCRRATLKAMELDEMLPQAYAMLGVLRAIEYDWKGAENEFRRAIELGPEDRNVWEPYITFYLVPMRRLDEARPS